MGVFESPGIELMDSEAVLSRGSDWSMINWLNDYRKNVHSIIVVVGFYALI